MIWDTDIVKTYRKQIKIDNESNIGWKIEPIKTQDTLVVVSMEIDTSSNLSNR